MTNNNSDNKLIQILSPITGMQFKIELNGEEQCLRELLGTILEIPPESIKGIKDSYNNYYTLSSALKSKNINTSPNNFYSVITENIINNSDYDLGKHRINTNDYIPNKELYNNPNYYLFNNRFINDDNLFFYNNRMNNIHNIQNLGIPKIRNNFYGNNFMKNYNIKDYYYLINFLYDNHYINNKNYYKLKKCIDINNQDVIEIMKPFIEFDDNYDKLIDNLFPILNLDLGINNEFSMKNDNSSSSVRYNLYKQILNNLKEYFTSENIKELNYLLLMENIEIIKIFKIYEKIKDKNTLINSLYNLLKKISKTKFRSKSNNGLNKVIKERKSKSQNYKKVSKKTNNYTNNIQNQKSNNKKTDNKELLKEITNKIIDYGKNFTKDIYYLMKIELKYITEENKMTLFSSKFKININANKNKEFELNNTIKKNIKNYYNKYIKANIYKFLNDEEKKIYQNIIEETKSQEYHELMKIYSDMFKNNKSKNKLELLRNTIINYLKKIIEQNEEEIEEEKQEEESKGTSRNKDKDNKGSKESKESEEEEDNIIKIEANEEEEEEQDEQNKKDKNDKKESSFCSSTVMDVEEEENYQNYSEESGVSIRKQNRPKKN